MSYTIPTSPLWIDAGEDDNEPLYDGSALRAAFGGLLAADAVDQSVARSGATTQDAMSITTTGLAARAQAGTYVIGTPDGVYVAPLMDDVSVESIPPADATNPRKDLVVLRIDDPSNSGGDEKAATIEYLAGEPAADPSLPSVEGATGYDVLAEIDVPKSGGGQPSVTDRRNFTAAAGGTIYVEDENDLDDVRTELGQTVYVGATNDLKVRSTAGWKSVYVADSQSDFPTIAAGHIKIKPTANENTQEWIDFPAGRFDSAPAVVVTASSVVMGTKVEGVAATDVTKDGFKANIRRTNTTATTLFWIAVGQR